AGFGRLEQRKCARGGRFGRVRLQPAGRLDHDSPPRSGLSRVSAEDQDQQNGRGASDVAAKTAIRLLSTGKFADSVDRTSRTGRFGAFEQLSKLRKELGNTGVRRRRRCWGRRVSPHATASSLGAPHRCPIEWRARPNIASRSRFGEAADPKATARSSAGKVFVPVLRQFDRLNNTDDL